MLRLPDMAAAEALQRKLTGGKTVQAPARKVATTAQEKEPSWSDALADQLRIAGLPAPVLEYHFAKPERNYRGLRRSGTARL